MFKVNPPLRTDADVAAVRAGLADGSIDCIATDHAPHTQEAKEAPFDAGAPGHARPADGPWPGPHRARPPVRRRRWRSCRWRPARILGDDAHGGPIEAGRAANLVVIDPEATWVVDPAALASRSRNTPYAGRTLRGVVRHTFLHGEPVVLDGEAQR